MKVSTALLLLISLLLTTCQSTAATPASSPTLRIAPKPTRLATARPRPSPTPAPARLAQPTDTISGGSITLGLVGQPQSLNPITENNPALRELTPLLFDTLLQVDPDTASLQPGLAQSWEFSANGRQVTFHLPPDLKWNDGSPLTAAAVASRLQATQHPALQAFRTVSAPDDQTLTARFDKIDCGALTTLALLPLIPADRILDPVPPGSGPYRVEEWSEDRRRLRFTRNPHYRGPTPYLDDVTVRFVQENEVDIALSEGNFDAFGLHAASVPAAAPPYLRDLAYPAPQVIYIAMNHDPQNEVPIPQQVRRALRLALDREVILAETLDEDGQLAAGSLLPGHWAANETLSPPAYDPETARRLLARSGLTDSDSDGWLDREGQRLELAIRLNGNNPLHQRLGWLVSSYYRDLGLYSRAESVPPDSIIDDLFTHDFGLALYSWSILPDPDQRPYWLAAENEAGLGLNFTSYNNPRLDNLLEDGVAVAGCQPDERRDIYASVQKVLSQDRPVDFLLTPRRHLLVSDRLLGPEPGPFAPITWNVTDWRIQE